MYAIGHRKEWEQWIIGKILFPRECVNRWTEHLPNGRYSIRSHHNQYLGVDGAGRLYTIGHCKEWEQWTIDRLPNGKVSIKSHFNSYLGVEPNFKVYVIGHCKEWEQFDWIVL